ncbi:MAG: signal recognition particle-docking protein FtsY [Acidimicrobiales bacterium]|nr:signal recognition particle-docking protein FtsY [Acidimicrobiales bacterium]
MEVLFLVLALLVLVFGFGVIIVRRRRAPGVEPPITRPPARPVSPPPPSPAAPPVAEAPPLEVPPVAEAPPLEVPPVVEAPPLEVPPVVEAPPLEEVVEAAAVEALEVEAPAVEVPPVVEAPPLEEVVEAAAVEVVEAEAVPVEAPAKPRFRDRLSKARTLLATYVGAIRSRSTIDEDTWDEIEEALIRADVGVTLTGALVEELRATVRERGIVTPDELLEALKAELVDRLGDADRSLAFEDGRPNVWLFVGVNGVGKTTTIGKVAKQEIAGGRTVVMAAGDTFRAAAGEQLEVWAERAGADLVRGAEGGDPSAVIFDAVERAGSRGYDLVLADTAGRLHTKVNLMEELKKVRRVADRDPGRVTEVLLVLDATTGQNGLTQARQFTDAVDVTGVVLTKLDGSAKGGIVLAIQGELGIPVKLVGLGETVEDLVPFDPVEFVDALFA